MDTSPPLAPAVTPGSDRPPRRQRVIDAPLQYREARLAAVIAVLSVNLVVLVGSLAPDLVGISVTLSNTGHIVLGVAEAMLLVAVWQYSVRRTLAIAGPAYAITREVSKLADGDVAFRIRLRPGDAFQHHAQRINDATDLFNDRIRRMKALVDALDTARRPEEANALRAELAALLAGIRTRE